MLNGDINATRRVAQIVFDACHFTGKVVGSAALGPKGSLAVDYIFLTLDYSINIHADGFDSVSHQDYVTRAATSAIFSTVPFDELGGETLSEATRKITKGAADTVLDEFFKETMESIVKNPETLKVVNSFLAEFLKEGIGSLTEDMLP